MGPTRDDFEIWKGVKSIATKLSQVHNRKIYSFILRMIPGPGTGTNLSLSSLPSQPGRCRLRHDFNVNDTKLPNTQQSRHPASASYLAGVMKAGYSSYRFSSVTKVCFHLRPEQSLLTPLFAAQPTVTGSPRARPDQAVQARPGRWSSQNLSRATLTGGIWRLPVWSVKYWVCRAGIGSRLCRQFVTLELLVKICSEECKACVHAWIWY